MEKQGVGTRVIRTVDHDIASGVYPDMREHGWATDEWPELYPAVQDADIVVVAGPIWLGDNSSADQEADRTPLCPLRPDSTTKASGRSTPRWAAA